MTSPSTSTQAAAPPRPKRATAQSRSPSTSEIARNAKHFETWSANQGCEQVSFSDLPDEFRADVNRVFDVSGRLPLAWVEKKHKDNASWTNFAPYEIKSFVRQAYQSSPDMFSDEFESGDTAELYGQISIVFAAWKRLKQMHKSKERWSEADYVANIYNVFRSPALQEATQRAHCPISLPQPLRTAKLGTRSSRILNAKTAIPDSTLFLPNSLTRPLSHSSSSPFKVLKSHRTILRSGSASKHSSFRYQATPCANLPDTTGFEFASAFWEDKKDLDSGCAAEDAYRQNRMACAGGLRHLRSLKVKAPVFGLVWASASVRAHLDWYRESEDESSRGPIIFSAPYPGHESADGLTPSSLFHEWSLDKPGDILEVYFLIRNIDSWTVGRFYELVCKGVNRMVKEVIEEGGSYEPWKRVGDLPLAPKARKENISVETEDTTPEKVVAEVKVRKRTESSKANVAAATRRKH